MKTNKMMAAGVAFAGAGAVALTTLAPATQTELTAAPVESHQVVLTGFDFGENLELLWAASQAKTAAQSTLVTTLLTLAGPGIEAQLKDDPVRTLVTLPGNLSALLQVSDIVAGGGKLPGNSLALIGLPASPSDIPQVGVWNPAVSIVAGKLDAADLTVLGESVRQNQNVQNVFKTENLRQTVGAGQRLNALFNAADSGDPVKVVNQFVKNRQALRDSLAQYNVNDELSGGSIKALRDATNTARDKIAGKVIAKLPTGVQGTANKINDGVKDLRKNIEKAVDKVGSAVSKTLKKANDAADNATD